GRARAGRGHPAKRRPGPRHPALVHEAAVEAVALGGVGIAQTGGQRPLPRNLAEALGPQGSQQRQQASVGQRLQRPDEALGHGSVGLRDEVPGGVVIGRAVAVLMHVGPRRHRRIHQQLEPGTALLAHGGAADGGGGGVQLLAQLSGGLASSGFLPQLQQAQPGGGARIGAVEAGHELAEGLAERVVRRENYYR
nr:hypothetical protein [Tanacetum cinerariifolium]